MGEAIEITSGPRSPTPRRPLTTIRRSALVGYRDEPGFAAEQALNEPAPGSTGRRGRTPRLSSAPTADHLRGLSAPAEMRPRPRTSRGRSHHLRGQSTVVNPSGGLISEGPSARRDRPRPVFGSSHGSFAATPTRASRRAPARPLSTTSASAAPRRHRLRSPPPEPKAAHRDGRSQSI